MPYDVFIKLYDNMVWPVIAYGAAVWGDKNAVQNRAMIFFLGVGKYTSYMTLMLINCSLL